MFNENTHQLFFYHNGTGPPPSDLKLTSAKVQTLLNVNATQAKPVVGLTISGITFRDSAPTYMEPHGVPSGGDWALERRAGVFFEGTEGLVVDKCSFQRLDGNGLMLSGYNKRATISHSDFAWTGGSAIAAWGRTDELSDSGKRGWDATGGDFPYDTQIISNVMCHIPLRNGCY